MLYRRWTGWAAAVPPPYLVRVLLVPLAPVILILTAPYLIIRRSLLSSPAWLRGLALLVLSPLYLPSYVLCRLFQREFKWVVNGFHALVAALKGGSSRVRCVYCGYRAESHNGECPFCFDRHGFLGFGEPLRLANLPYDPEYRGPEDTS